MNNAINAVQVPEQGSQQQVSFDEQVEQTFSEMLPFPGQQPSDAEPVAASPEAPEPAKAPEKVEVGNPGWLADGQSVALVFKAADSTRKETVLKYCPTYAGNEQAQSDFLKAFKETYGGNASAVQTASKIKSVFEAWEKPSFEYVVGMNEE